MDLKDVKVVVGIPSGDMVHVDFALSVNAMLIYSLQQQVPILSIVNKKGSIVHQARCSIAEDAKSAGATHLLFIDSDHVIPRDLLVNMLKADKDIIGLHQVTKRPPIRSNCEDLKGNRLTKPGTGIEEVARIGTGLMLINMKVLEKMKQPYFEFKWEKGMFKTPHWVGEDYNFCEAARHKGFKIYVDHDLSKQAFHLGTTMFGVQELERA